MSATKGLELLAAAAVMAVAAGCASVPRTPSVASDVHQVETLCEFARDPQPEGLSGISRIGGHRYLCVNDRGGELHEMEIVLAGDGEVKRCKARRRVVLAGRHDLEDCAVDPLDGKVWVADEHDTSIRQFDPATGQETAEVMVPETFRSHVRPNRSFEALTITPDGLSMYVANEDTLTCDGPAAGKKCGGLVRIQEFVRFGKGGSWVATRQFRYRTSPVEGDPFSGIAISGVAGLCATGDGRLMVLEREMSKKNPLYPSFHARLFEISLDDGADVVAKNLLWDENTMFSNYEGICLGPRLQDGSRALVLISDGGGEAEENVLVLSLRSIKPVSPPASR